MSSLKVRLKKLEAVISVSNELTPFLLELWQIGLNPSDSPEPPQDWIDWFSNTTHEERMLETGTETTASSTDTESEGMAAANRNKDH